MDRSYNANDQRAVNCDNRFWLHSSQNFLGKNWNCPSSQMFRVQIPNSYFAYEMFRAFSNTKLGSWGLTRAETLTPTVCLQSLMIPFLSFFWMKASSCWAWRLLGSAFKIAFVNFNAVSYSCAQQSTLRTSNSVTYLHTHTLTRHTQWVYRVGQNKRHRCTRLPGPHTFKMSKINKQISQLK